MSASVPCLVLTEPAEREARPCQHRRAHRASRPRTHVLDAPIIIQETMDALHIPSIVDLSIARPFLRTCSPTLDLHCCAGPRTLALWSPHRSR